MMYTLTMTEVIRGEFNESFGLPKSDKAIKHITVHDSLDQVKEQIEEWENQRFGLKFKYTLVDEETGRIMNSWVRKFIIENKFNIII
jgi:hypothetical protein